MPSLKYALGVAGLVAVVAIVKSFGIKPQFAVFGAVITLVLMVALVLFARLTATTSENLLVPVLVLMWSFLVLTIATALLLFTSAFFRWPLPDLLSNGTTASPGRVRALVEAARLQREAGDNEGSWNRLKEAHDLSPNSSEVLQAQVQTAMAWLEHVVVPEGKTFSDIVDVLVPCLYQAVAKTTGSSAADIYAHIGWANFLKLRESALDLDVEGQYRRAVQLDPINPYAHAMWGHWIMTKNGVLAEAQKHFELALKSGRAKDFVLRFEIAALQWTHESEHAPELIRAANQMRTNQIPLSDDEKARLYSEIYPASSEVVLKNLQTILPPQEHLATFTWLSDAYEESEPGTKAFFLARLTEATGDYQKALALYLQISPRFMMPDEVKNGIERCRQNVSPSVTTLQMLISSCGDPDPDAQLRAVRGLAGLAAPPEQVVPTFASAAVSSNAEVRAAACEALANLGVAALPGVRQILRSQEPRDLQNGAKILGTIGTNAGPAVPSLITLLQHTNSEVREASIDALGEIGPAAAEAVQPLMDLLRRRQPVSAMLSIAYTLGEIGPKAKGAVPALIDLLKSDVDRDGFLNVNAADALGKIGPDAAEAVPALAEALKSENPRLPTRATEALGSIGAQAKSAVPALIQAMNDEDQEHRVNQADALGKIAIGLLQGADISAIETLKTMLRAMEEQNFEAKILAPVREALDALKEKALSSQAPQHQ